MWSEIPDYKKGVLREANMEVTDENREKFDEVTYEVIGETSIHERCSGDWRKIGKQIKPTRMRKRNSSKGCKQP